MYALRRRNVSRMGRKALTIISILKAKTQLRVEAAAGAQCHDGDSSKLIDSCIMLKFQSTISDVRDLGIWSLSSADV